MARLKVSDPLSVHHFNGWVAKFSLRSPHVYCLDPFKDLSRLGQVSTCPDVVILSILVCAVGIMHRHCTKRAYIYISAITDWCWNHIQLFLRVCKYLFCYRNFQCCKYEPYLYMTKIINLSFAQCWTSWLFLSSEIRWTIHLYSKLNASPSDDPGSSLIWSYHLMEDLPLARFFYSVPVISSFSVTLSVGNVAEVWTNTFSTCCGESL